MSVLVYNLGNLWRRLVLPTRIDRWSLASLQQRLVKTGGRLVKHARYYCLLLVESHLTKRLFGAMLSGSGRCRCRRADGRMNEANGPGTCPRGDVSVRFTGTVIDVNYFYRLPTIILAGPMWPRIRLACGQLM